MSRVSRLLSVQVGLPSSRCCRFRDPRYLRQISPPSPLLYFAGLPVAITEEGIRELVAPYGMDSGLAVAGGVPLHASVTV